ncbi:hypothetical protein N8978_02330 [Flavobacteriaceae bacterium]|jgi:hypothetical protein|nr:hypothetical protein [Flavobacteriaceae bacterium]|tara:strand:+ start:1026 stop:1850 length:825 start_codon:yes stop_codon:yes gene_type:complete
MKKIAILLIIIISQTISSQKIEKDYPLSNIIEETSGLEIVDNLFVTHNDSGGEASLYYLSKKGEIKYKRKISSAKNKDWEDITRDDKYIYIADMGNNFNNRKDLKIYKIPIDKDSEEKNETIYFNYPEQDSFKIDRNTIYDAEGLISVGKNLVIFTKNRAKKITELYLVPKKPGTYDAKKIGKLNVNSIVTGADYNENYKILALTSTKKFNNYYLIIINDFSFEQINNSNINTYEIPIGKTQVEAVKIIDNNNFWITSEDEKNSKSARLMKLKL